MGSGVQSRLEGGGWVARFHLVRWLACWLGLATLACADEPPSVIDCHVHLWDVARPAGLGWIKKDDKTLYLGRFNPTRPNLNEYVTVTPSDIKENVALAINFEANQKLWDNYGLKTLPITVHTKLKDSKEWKALDDKSMPLQPNKETYLYKGPGMDSNKYFRLSADIGGFPRAVVFDAKPNMPMMELVNEDQVSITGIRPIAKDRTDVKLSDQKGRFVFPNRIGNIQVFYDGFEVDAVLDRAPNSKAVMEISNRETPGTAGIPPIDIEFDRWYKPFLSAESDGLLGIAFEAAEMHFRPKIKTDDLNGVYVVAIRTGGASCHKGSCF